MDVALADHLDLLTSYVYEIECDPTGHASAARSLRAAVDRALQPPVSPRLVNGLPAPDWWPTDDQIAADGTAAARALGAAV